jgi:hypothetical protein
VKITHSPGLRQQLEFIKRRFLRVNVPPFFDVLSETIVAKT